MKAALYSHDEVNCFVGDKLAEKVQMTLVAFAPKDGRPGDHDLPSVIDMDSCAPTHCERKALIAELAANGHMHPVAVFSRNLEDEDIDRLTYVNILVARRMDRLFFVEFARIMRDSQKPLVLPSTSTPTSGS